MDAAEELKLTYKFECEKIATPRKDQASRGKHNGKLGLQRNQNLNSIYHVMNNKWFDWLMNNSHKWLHIYEPHD
jgi:hypothetical protein